MDSRIYSEKMIQSIKHHMNKNSSKFITYPKFVFLCGRNYKENEYFSSNRGIIEKYIRIKSQDVFIVLSEKMWEEGFNSSIDLLTFEEFLAEISDAIILLVESPGTFCELGAFSYAEKLFNEKLIIVIDEKRKGEKSFILTGPTAKAQSDGATVIYAQTEGTGILSSAELREIIEKKVQEFATKGLQINKKNPNYDEAKVALNSFILEILELIKIVQPVNRNDLLNIYKAIKGFSSFTFVKKNGEKFHSEIKFDYIIKLLTTVGLVKQNDKQIITTDFEKKTQSLMFNYTNTAENKERSKLLCRKFRYKGV